ncbi:hypothetical protein [Streptomyces xanthii]|uniref:Uncharacterized protein n=1 Tax=Streptomyces xanthii TaxID=2768069 RepID=A0A7H1B9J7_9ACTN|nr:hypothetical protein [Streptomyces xanthii]QNS05402.1 hypothetical protein IAG42_18575 [Streptomyces xanthii]
MSPTRFASEHKWIYVGAIVLLVALAIIGIIQYESVKTGNEAAKKANQLADAAEEAGYPRPDTETIERALGTDGGTVCEDPAGALASALWKINVSNGAAFVGQRPVIGDARALRAEAEILKIYCPDKLDTFKDKLDDLKTDDTVRRNA